jgi:hypothetical protein
MPIHICVTCGVEHASSPQPPHRCLICEDERQFVGEGGQKWTTLEAIRKTHSNILFQESPGVWGIHTTPKFAIGQRALLIQHPQGNILWDCVTLLDSDTVALVKALGGVAKIAISHPHYYSSMIEWSRAFNSPVVLHENDREWVQRPDPAIQFWSGETHELAPGATLVRVGGHFAGFQNLHYGRALFTGDLPQVCPDRRWVSFLYSYPNMIPLSAPSVRRIVETLDPFDYDELYGAWPRFVVKEDAKRIVRQSAERYIDALGVDR